LRVAIGTALVVQGAAYFLVWRELGFVTLGVALLALASGALLLIGYLTPFAGALAGLISLGRAFSWFPPPNLNLFEARSTAALATVIAAALVCLGPGAFSLDGRLYGRREIVIPDTSPSLNS
jgi:uncharacterized membrane protein YphA (DoxX/SURF4 family)